MKGSVFPLACAAFFACGSAIACAETPLELLERAQRDLQAHVDAAKKEQAGKKEQPPDNSRAGVERTLEESYSLYVPLRSLQSMHEQIVSGRTDHLLATLEEFQADMRVAEDVRKDVDALAKLINKEQADQEEAYAQAVDAACQRASEILPKATEPKELDGLQRELTQLAAKPPGRNHYNGGDDSHLGNKLQAAVQFVNHWQDYLLARSRNNEEGQAQALRSLTDGSGYNQVALVPRSEILARMPQKESTSTPTRPTNRPGRPQAQLDADAVEIVQGVKKLDDIPGALTKLVDLRKEITAQPSYNFRSESDLGTALTTLQGLERTFLEIQNGLATSISLGASRANDYNSHPEIDNAVIPLRVQLIKLAAPRLLGAGENAKATADETLDTYLKRLIDAAKQRRDWAAVARGLELKQTLATTSSAPYATINPQEAEAFKNFFAGNNLEAAGQYEQAVISYLNALRSGQEDLPSASIGEHLAALEKAHPAEYASGKEYVLNPPRSPFGPFGDPRAGYPGGGMSQRTFDPRFPGARMGMSGPSVDEKLAVPAASPSPALPSPSPAPGSPTPSAPKPTP